MNLSHSMEPSLQWIQDSINCNSNHEKTGVIYLGLEAREGITLKMIFKWQDFTRTQVVVRPGEQALGKEWGKLCTEV